MVQRVALKVTKAAMDSKAVVARFEQKRQALAVMDHPNVARVFDGGVTPTGRPYFVMEHVKGEPITGFADRNRLTITQRLELFVPVCEAVQHAHMKGIIHRDIMPTNVLVAPGGEGHTPIVKVIDFGVANARRLADFLTGFGRARVGVGYAAERFALAEANLLEAHPIYVAAKGVGRTHKDTLECVQALVDLYTAWDTAEPGKGYDAKAAEWRAKLPAAEPAVEPADKR
jgi:serine/threonine protein kinase